MPCFSAGLPFYMFNAVLTLRLAKHGVDIAIIGFFAWVALLPTFKFLWAPLMDRFELPWLGRRRGWLVLTQLALAGTLLLLAGTSPSDATRTFALLAVLVMQIMDILPRRMVRSGGRY